MATRFIPVSLAVPAHLHYLDDTDVISKANDQLARSNPKLLPEDKPFVVHPLDPGQFVSGHPAVARKIARDQVSPAKRKARAARAARRSR